MKKSDETLKLENALEFNKQEQDRLRSRERELQDRLFESLVKDSGLKVGDHIKLHTGVVVMVTGFRFFVTTAQAIYRCYDGHGNLLNYDSGSENVMDAQIVKDFKILDKNP